MGKEKNKIILAFVNFAFENTNCKHQIVWNAKSQQ